MINIPSTSNSPIILLTEESMPSSIFSNKIILAIALIAAVAFGFLAACYSSIRDYFKDDSKEHQTSQTEKEATILKMTSELKETNKKFAAAFNSIQHFIESDPDLLSKFHECLNQTSDILLPPPLKNNSEPVNNPIAEAWRLESHQNHYFEQMKARFIDFLDKNPDFCQLLKKKMEVAKDWNSSQLNALV